MLHQLMIDLLDKIFPLHIAIVTIVLILLSDQLIPHVINLRIPALCKAILGMNLYCVNVCNVQFYIFIVLCFNF